MSNDLLLTFVKDLRKLISKFGLHLSMSIQFYFYFLSLLTKKATLSKMFIWKISNFSDLYWFFYTSKDIKTLNLLIK